TMTPLGTEPKPLSSATSPATTTRPSTSLRAPPSAPPGSRSRMMRRRTGEGHPLHGPCHPPDRVRASDPDAPAPDRDDPAPEIAREKGCDGFRAANGAGRARYDVRLVRVPHEPPARETVLLEPVQVRALGQSAPEADAAAEGGGV